MIVQAMPYPANATPSPGANYFANNGVTSPIYGSTVAPAAIYVSSTDTTWFTWEGLWDRRVVFVCTYHHATATWTDPVIISTNTLSGDDHGVPAIARDADGHVHIFYGAHNSSLRHASTTNPDDPSAWTERSVIAGLYSYPKPVLIGSTIYLFLREGAAGVENTPLVVVPSTAVASGAVTWGTPVVLADPETDLRLYTGAPVVAGTKVHIPGSIADSGDTFRRHVYYFIYETADGSLHNHDSSTATSSGSLPVGKATMDSDYRIVDMGTDSGGVPELCIDSNGDPHIAYTQGSGSSFTLNHVVRQSGTWSSADPRDTVDDRHCQPVLIPLSGGAVHLYYEDDAGTFTRGGNIERQIWSSGSWGPSSTILAATDFGLTSAKVYNANADARVVFFERRNTGVGQLRIYAYGDSGFVTRPESYETETDTLIAAFTTPPTQRRKELIDSIIAGLKTAGIWSKLDVLHIFAAADSQAALINWKNPGTFDASLVNAPAFTADRQFATNGVNSYIDTGFNPATAGGHFSRDSAMFGIYARTGGVASSPAGWFNGTNGVTLRPMSSATGNSDARINSAGSVSAPGGSNFGFFAVNRSSPTAIQLFQEGALGGTASQTSTAMVSNNLYLGRSAAATFVAYNFGADVIGESITTGEHSELNKAIHTYMMAVGADV